MHERSEGIMNEYVDRAQLILQNMWLCGSTLASDAKGLGSTPGGTIELDTCYHPLVGR